MHLWKKTSNTYWCHSEVEKLNATWQLTATIVPPSTVNVMLNEEDCCFQCQEPRYITWHCLHIRFYECNEYSHIIIDCPYRIPPSGTPVTNHTKSTMLDQVWGTTVKIEKCEANPDHSPTSKDFTAWVIMICIEAALDHNIGIDTTTTGPAHDELTQPTEETATDLTMTHHTGHIAYHPDIKALQIINP